MIVTPAVVCGTYTWQTPSATPDSLTACATFSVISTSCARRLVRTSNVTQPTTSIYREKLSWASMVTAGCTVVKPIDGGCTPKSVMSV